MGHGSMTFEEFRQQWEDSRDFIIAHTSGSTGVPKEIRLLKGDMVTSAKATNRFFGIGHNSSLLCPLSLDYIAGKMMAVRAIIAGCEVKFQPPSRQIEVRRCDLLAIVPVQCESFLQQYTPDVKAVIIGGARLSPTVSTRLIEMGVNAYESYGMTETCSHVALKKVGTQYFEAMPGVTFTTDLRGCLVVNVPGMSIRHVVTNDVVDLVSSTKFDWIGRADFVINSGAVKVHPEQVEAQMRATLDRDVPFYVTAREDFRWGQRPVVVTDDRDAVESLTRAICAIDDKVKRPDGVVTVKALMYGDNSKIKRMPLSELEVIQTY